MDHAHGMLSKYFLIWYLKTHVAKTGTNTCHTQKKLSLTGWK